MRPSPVCGVAQAWLVADDSNRAYVQIGNLNGRIQRDTSHSTEEVQPTVLADLLPVEKDLPLNGDRRLLNRTRSRVINHVHRPKRIHPDAVRPFSTSTAWNGSSATTISK